MIQDGGQDADGDKHHQISHGPTGIQRVGGRGLRQRQSMGLRKTHGWMALTGTVWGLQEEEHMIAAGEDDDRRRTVALFFFPIIFAS